MTDNSHIQSAKDFVPKSKGRQSPAGRWMEQMSEEYYALSDAADILGVHMETVRRLCRTDKVDAPSNVFIKGGFHMWLVNEVDLIELGQHYGAMEEVRAHLKEKYVGQKMPKKIKDLLGDKK